MASFVNPETGRSMTVDAALRALNSRKDVKFEGIFVNDLISSVVRQHTNPYYTPIEDYHVMYEHGKFIVSYKGAASKKWQKKDDVLGWFKAIKVPTDPEWKMKTLLKIAEFEDLDEVFVVTTFYVGPKGTAMHTQNLAFLARDVGAVKAKGLWRIVRWLFADSKSNRAKRALGESRRSKVLALGVLADTKPKVKSEKNVKKEK